MPIRADDVNGLLRKAVGMLGRMRKRLEPTADADAQLLLVQQDLGVPSGATFVADAAWDQKPDADRSTAYAKLKAFVRELRKLQRAELAPGAIVFVALATLLCVLAVLYHRAHTLPRNAQASGISDQHILEVLATREAILQGLSTAAAKTEERAASTDANVKKALTADLDRTFAQLSSLTVKFQDALLRDGFSAHLSSSTLAAWAQVVAQIAAGQVAAKASFETLRKSLDPEVDSLRTRYLWTEVPRRWFEIAWWAEFGTLVGLLFYVAGCLESGIFKTEELSMFLTELVITPLVVTVVFFLFGFTGISGFAPNESNIAQTVGFAFILGFAIRRTVGLLDLIKKRFLPDPTPADQATL
jgi:hypothetical protein